MNIEAPKTQFALANGCVVVKLIANFDDQGTIVFSFVTNEKPNIDEYKFQGVIKSLTLCPR